MNTSPTDVEKRRYLPWYLAHSLANAIFAQLTFFGPVFILFLDELGLDKTRIGLLFSFIPFSGLVALFIAPAVARAGVKRIFITFWGIRKGVTSLLLFTPWVLARFGAELTFFYVAGIVALFALCRAIAETAFYPWYQEIVPNAIRGQFTAIVTVIDTLASILTLAGASLAISQMAGLQRFTLLLGIGVIFGVLCVACALPIPGGAPGQHPRTAHLRQLRAAWADDNFRRYLGSLGLVTLALMAFSFVPLFMREEVGLEEKEVLLLQVGVYTGGMLSSYLWGWAADRYGSRPVAQVVLFLMALLPIGWLWLPRHTPWSNPIALLIAVSIGIANYGWQVSNNRLLFVSVVPPEHRIQYMALYYAWIGLLGGLGPLVGGIALDACADLKGQFLGFHLDPYAPLFVVSSLALLGGCLLLGRMRTESAMPARTLVGMFVRGNPFLAFRALIRYRLARHEPERIRIAEDLGQARSPLSAEGLLEALADPSFNVRYEALISIARTRPHPRLTQALIEILNSHRPDLSPAAAWALGRSGDPEGVPALRRALTSEYPLLRAQAARSLGQLGDRDSAAAIHALLRSESDPGLRVAYAAALGQLRAQAAATDLLISLRQNPDKAARAELALALARLLDLEGRFVEIWRRLDREAGAVLAQEAAHLTRWCRRLGKRGEVSLRPRLEEASQAFAQNELEKGSLALITAANALPLERASTFHVELLRQVAQGLREWGAGRLEYALLALLGIRAVLTAPKP